MRKGSGYVACTQLLISGICCTVSPLFFYAPKSVFLPFLMIWGITVAGDSPQFSTLNAKTAPRNYVGSALTMITSIGFFITIVSIQLESVLIKVFNPAFIFATLVIGPIFGLRNMRRILGSGEN